MISDLDKETWLNCAFVVRCKYGEFIDIKRYIMEGIDCKLLYDRCTFRNLVVKETFTTKEDLKELERTEV
jgi:hypothetical protein